MLPQTPEGIPMTEKTSYRPGEPTWIDLGTPDLDGAITFYGQLFGWEVHRGSEEFGGYSMFQRDGRHVAGVGPLMNPAQPPAWSTYISVEDADKTAALVHDHGGQVMLAPMQVADFGRMAVFTDPAGAVISAWQPLEHHGAQLRDDEGTFTWNELTTRDQDAVLPFYEAVFGWQAHHSEDYTEFRLAGEPVGGCLSMTDSVAGDQPSFWLPYFAAADPAAQAIAAADLGGVVLLPFLDFGAGTCAIAADPDGAAFGLLALNS